MKRFWTAVTVEPGEGGFGIALDGKAVRTPARAPLAVPTKALAEAIAAEWTAVEGDIDPRAMPLSGLANAAVDRIAPEPRVFAASLAKYAEADLLCYRTEGPSSLIERQEAEWDPLLAWARRRFDVDFRVTQGLMHVAQPKATVERLSHAVASLDAWHLAGLSPLVTIGGSLVAALAVVEAAVGADAAWQAVSLDERWQIEQWGADAEAEAALEGRRRDFLAAARFVELVD